MSITGGIKFFDKSKSLGKDGATISASSGSSGAAFAIDRNPLTVWRSSGSDDTTTETLTITFPAATTFSRIFLIGHNFKEFNVQYNNSGFTHFSSVTGLDGSKANISETAFADSTAYYEVASVTTDQLRIQVVKTQTANEEKFLNQVIVTNELGTLVGYPEVSDIPFSRSSRVGKMLSGRMKVQKSLPTLGVTLNLNPYPAGLEADLDLLFSLNDREEPFLTWLCGGRRGQSYFRWAIPGFRLGDVVPMQLVTDLTSRYKSNYYCGAIEASFELYEVTT